MHDFKEIVLEEYNGIAKISINRPRYRNAFTPLTTAELSQAFSIDISSTSFHVHVST